MGIIKARRNSQDVPIGVEVERDGGITGLTVVARLLNPDNLSQYYDQDDDTFKDAGHVTPNFALTEASAANNPGFYGLEGGLDLSAITIPQGLKGLYVFYDITGGGESGNDIDVIVFDDDPVDGGLHFDGDAASNPDGGLFADPIGGGQAGFTDLITAMNDPARGGVKAAYLKYEADFIRPAAAGTTLQNKIFRGSHGIYVGIDPNDQDWTGCVFEDLILQSTGTLGFGAFGPGFGGITAKRCLVFAPLAQPQAGSYYNCAIATTTAAPLRFDVSGQEVNFYDCSTWRPNGIDQPAYLDFSNTANVRALFHRFSGEVIARNMSESTTLLQVAGAMDVQVEANCSDGRIRLLGSGSISVAVGATVTIEDQRFEDGARIDIQPIRIGTTLEATACLYRFGKVITDATSATLTIYDNSGVQVYQQTIAGAPTVSASGAYVFSGTPSPALVQGTYTALLSITDPISTVTSQVDILGVA